MGINKKYRIYDRTGAWVTSFNTWKEAHAFCVSRGRLDWTIK